MALDEVNVKRMVVQFAQEHLEQMQKVPWHSFASHLAERSPRTGGETFGCEEDGQYFDVGDKVEWAAEPGGDILLTAFSTAEVAGRELHERLETIIHRPETGTKQ